jgi:hypothetical protein
LLSLKIGAAVIAVAAVSATVVLRTSAPAPSGAAARAGESAAEAGADEMAAPEVDPTGGALPARERAHGRTGTRDERGGELRAATPERSPDPASTAASEPEARVERTLQRASAGRTTSGHPLQRAARGGAVDTSSVPDEEPMLAVPVEALAPSLRAELELIAAAQRAVREGEPARALAYVDEHAARFPRGVLVQERLAIAALSWCERGDARHGGRFVTQLARRAPASPLLARARAACQKVASE